VLSQPPDGYTILQISASQHIRSAMPNPLFDIRKDLALIGRIVYARVFAVSADKLPNVKTMKELIDYARANPGKVNFGSYGTGTLGHLALAYLVQQTASTWSMCPTTARGRRAGAGARRQPRGVRRAGSINPSSTRARSASWPCSRPSAIRSSPKFPA